MNTEVRVIFLYLFPDILPGSRISGVHKNIIAVKEHLDVNTRVCFYQKSLLLHLPVIFTPGIHLRPYGNHGLDSQLMEPLHHFLRIREIFLVKPIIAAPQPVKVVNHQNVQGNFPLFVLLGNSDNLFLIIIAQLTLPEAQPVFRHHRDFPRRVRIMLFNFRRRIPCGNPVIQLSCALRHPLGGI